jgi:chemosensory pili system protein ChpA (sensor histidine kinase/response regulator)
MVPFFQYVPRLNRLVRQAAGEANVLAELNVTGSSGELDRQVLEKMLPPFEHMLRNSVAHGIESREERLAAGKPETGNINIDLQREGAEVVIVIADDGRGVDTDAVRAKATELGILTPASEPDDEQVLQFILRPGFSTADRVTQAAGRGVGMDVVANEISRLGGTLRIDSELGAGTRFTIRLPFTLAVTQALIVRSGAEIFALPLPTVEGVTRISRSDFDERMQSEDACIEYGGQSYRIRQLGPFVGLSASRLPDDDERVSLILVNAGESSTALVSDEMLDSREIVVKPVGPQLSSIRGIAGATILGDGRVVMILDAGALVRAAGEESLWPEPAPEPPREDLPPLAMVVDDSITMRRVSQRLLERNGFRVVTAKDGVEALGLLGDEVPDIMLLDIEMPRMDGYELATHVRNDPATGSLPIIMITSRVSEKHKARAIELGVNDYLGKPYQEQDLLDAVNHQLGMDASQT